MRSKSRQKNGELYRGDHPKEIIDQIGIVENEKITVQFKKGHNIRDSFGILSDWKVTTDKIKAEMKKGWG